MRFERPEWLDVEAIKPKVKEALIPIAQAALRSVLTCVVGFPYQQAETIAQKIEAKIPIFREP